MTIWEHDELGIWRIRNKLPNDLLNTNATYWYFVWKTPNRKSIDQKEPSKTLHARIQFRNAYVGRPFSHITNQRPFQRRLLCANCMFSETWYGANVFKMVATELWPRARFAFTWFSFKWDLSEAVWFNWVGYEKKVEIYFSSTGNRTC